MVAALSAVARAQSRAPEVKDAAAPSPLEQALMDYACRAPAQAIPNPKVYETCLRGQLQGLRTNFGRDLQKLSSKERKGIDSVCSAVRAERGRDAYVACMSKQLTQLRNARVGTAPGGAPAQVGVPPAEPPAKPIEEVAAWLPPVTEPPLAEPATPVWTALLVLLAGLGALLGVRQRRAASTAHHRCRVCGVQTGTSGDLCAACRHEAAEARRRALHEHEKEARPAAAEAARPAPDAVEGPVAQGTPATIGEDERRAQLAAEHAEVERQQEEAARAREEETQRWQAAAAAAISAPASPTEPVFDPYAVLGLTATPSDAQIREAYEAAKAKYSADQVAHLGVELQDHYRRKAEAVERAFELLTSPVRV